MSYLFFFFSNFDKQKQQLLTALVSKGVALAELIREKTDKKQEEAKDDEVKVEEEMKDKEEAESSGSTELLFSIALSLHSLQLRKLGAYAYEMLGFLHQISIHV